MDMEACVRVTEARGLTSKDPNGKSDPFYLIGTANEKCTHLEDVSKCVRSKTIFCTLDPVWNKAQRADFITKNLSQKVRIELWDKDHAESNDFEGCAVVDITFNGQDYKESWHELQPRAEGEAVTGKVHVTIFWHHLLGVHQAVKTNREQRAARIFLSSTFVDMHDEREAIMRKVMVELDRFCYERQVALTYIDMRWGITAEMSNEYKTILSCLQEVDHSRPYFVGIIGQRYGWHQESDGSDKTLTKSFELAAAHNEYEWINKYRDRSVTELEILHGFLLHPSVPESHAFFYFRDPAYLDTLTPDMRAKFEDSTPYAKQQLKLLKERIASRALQWGSGCVENYKNPEELSVLLLADLKRAIDKDFPIATAAQNATIKQRIEHENYAHQRCHVYVARPQYYHLLDEAVKEKVSHSNGRYIMVTGQSGGGKSSLIANWWRSRTKASKKDATWGLLAETPTFIHFIGASLLSNSFNSMLTRLYEEINHAKKANEVKIEKPKDEDMIKSMTKFLNAASKRGGMLIIFDAVNQLPQKYHDLHWLPASLPPNIYILLSSTPDHKIMEAVRVRSGGALCHTAEGAGEGRWLHMAVQPLESDERAKIVSSRLAKYGKKMTAEDVNRVISHPCGSLPLFLTTVLTELCTIGFYDQFQTQLSSLLGCVDMPGVFQKVLERWEDGFGTYLAEKLLPLMACSRSGVAEKTIQVATEVPTMQLSPMLCAMKHMLVVNQSSTYNFGHEYLKQAVLLRYSPPELYYKASRKLAEALSKDPFDENTAAKLPWQLEKIMSDPLCTDGPAVQQQLADILLDLSKFMVFYEHDALKYDLIKYWEKLFEKDSKWKMGPLYVQSAMNSLPKANSANGNASAATAVTTVNRSIPLTSNANGKKQKWVIKVEETQEITFSSATHGVPPATMFALASFLFTVGLAQEARQVAELALSEYKITQDKNGIARALYLLGVILRDQGNLGEARKNLSQALELRVELFGECNAEVATSLDQLGWMLKSTGELPGAIQYFGRALAIQKALFGNRHEEVASSLNGLGSILCELNDVKRAKEYFDESLAISTELFGLNHPNVAQSLHNLAVLCIKTEQWPAALDVCTRALTIRTELFGYRHVDVAASQNILGTIHMQLNQSEKALECFTQAHKIQVELLDEMHPELAVTLQNLGLLYKRMNQLGEAKKYYEKSLGIRLALFGAEHPLVESSLHNLGGCLFAQGDLDKARGCFEKVLNMQKDRHGGYNHPKVQQTLGILEGVARKQGRNEEAIFYSSKMLQKTRSYSVSSSVVKM